MSAHEYGWMGSGGFKSLKLIHQPNKKKITTIIKIRANLSWLKPDSLIEVLSLLTLFWSSIIKFWVRFSSVVFCILITSIVLFISYIWFRELDYRFFFFLSSEHHHSHKVVHVIYVEPFQHLLWTFNIYVCVTNHFPHLVMYNQYVFHNILPVCILGAPHLHYYIFSPLWPFSSELKIMGHNLCCMLTPPISISHSIWFIYFHVN